MSMIDLDAIRERCAAVYPDWNYYGGPDAKEPKQGSLEAAPGLTVGTPHNTEPIARFSGYLMDVVANVEFVIHARADIPALIAEVEKLREALEIIEEVAKTCWVETDTATAYCFFCGVEFDLKGGRPPEQVWMGIELQHNDNCLYVKARAALGGAG